MMLSNTDYVLISNGARSVIVPVSDIVAIEVSGNYVTAELNGDKFTFHKTLEQCEESLDPSMFFKAGRRCLINLGKVKKVEMANAKQFLITMQNDKEVLMSTKQSLLLRQQKRF